MSKTEVFERYVHNYYSIDNCNNAEPKYTAIPYWIKYSRRRNERTVQSNLWRALKENWNGSARLSLENAENNIVYVYIFVQPDKQDDQFISKTRTKRLQLTNCIDYIRVNDWRETVLA